jgi:site-specific DNA-adenine methylase
MSKQVPDPPINFPKRTDGSLDFTNFYKPFAGGKYWFQLISDFEKKKPAWILIIQNSLIDYYKILKQNKKSVYHDVDYLRYLKAATAFMRPNFLMVAHPATQP